MKKGSDLLVSALENEGVDRIFGVPGEENLDVVESLRTSKIKLILPRHEQAAAFMAATHGRLTGKPGVCISTLGPGALNFSTGAPTQYTAYHVTVPFSVSGFIAAIIGGLGNPLGAFIGVSFSGCCNHSRCYSFLPAIKISSRFPCC